MNTICLETVDRDEAGADLGERTRRIAIGTCAIASWRTSTLGRGGRFLALVLVLEHGAQRAHAAQARPVGTSHGCCDGQ
jgi:hypothetical protein